MQNAYKKPAAIKLLSWSNFPHSVPQRQTPAGLIHRCTAQLTSRGRRYTSKVNRFLDERMSPPAARSLCSISLSKSRLFFRRWLGEEAQRVVVVRELLDAALLHYDYGSAAAGERQVLHRSVWTVAGKRRRPRPLGSNRRTRDNDTINLPLKVGFLGDDRLHEILDLVRALRMHRVRDVVVNAVGSNQPINRRKIMVVPCRHVSLKDRERVVAICLSRGTRRERSEKSNDGHHLLHRMLQERRRMVTQTWATRMIARRLQ